MAKILSIFSVVCILMGCGGELVSIDENRWVHLTVVVPVGGRWVIYTSSPPPRVGT